MIGYGMMVVTNRNDTGYTNFEGFRGENLRKCEFCQQFYGK